MVIMLRHWPIMKNSVRLALRHQMPPHDSRKLLVDMQHFSWAARTIHLTQLLSHLSEDLSEAVPPSSLEVMTHLKLSSMMKSVMKHPKPRIAFLKLPEEQQRWFLAVQVHLCRRHMTHCAMLLVVQQP